MDDFIGQRFILTTKLFCWVCILFICSTAAAQTDGRGSVEGQLISSSSGIVTVTTDESTGQAVFLSIENGAVQQPYNGGRTSNPRTAAVQFLNQYGSVFGLSSSDSVDVEQQSTSQAASAAGPGARGLVQSRSSVKMQQIKSGVPVYGAEVVVRLNGAAEVTGANGRLSSADTPTTTPSIDQQTARLTALSVTAKAHPIVSSMGLSVTESELMLYNPGLLRIGQDREFLVWRFEIKASNGPVRQLVMVNAENGRVLLSFNQTATAMYREIHEQNNDVNLSVPSGNIARSEGQGVTGDADVDNAYLYTGDFYNYFFNTHNRDSFDDQGGSLVAGVRVCESGLPPCPYNSAYWNGDLSLFGDSFVYDDIVAHEWVHGFTEKTSNLIYLNESGAINESFSDMWGEFIDLTYSSGPAGDDSSGVRWLIGEDTPFPFHYRDMSDPVSRFSPDKVTSSLYLCGPDPQGGPNDNGWVHWNSGVNNKAVTLMVDGGTFNGYTVNALGIPKTSHIYYEAQLNHLTQSSTYNDLGNSLVSACNILVGTQGITTSDCTDVENAVLAVEMNQTNACVDPPSPPLCDSGSVIDEFYDDFEVDNFSTVWDVVNSVGPGGVWSRATGNAFNGAANMFGNNLSVMSDSYVANQTEVSVPTGGLLAFEHLPDIERNYDGAVIELSTDSGASWQDVAPYFLHNSYNAFVIPSSNSPVADRDSYGGGTVSGYGGNYRRTIADLSSFTGQDVLVRFRIGTSSSDGYQGWAIDDVRIYSCGTVGGADPVAVDDTMTVDEGATQTELDGTVLTVLANDTDSDLPNDTLTAAVDQDVTNGTLTLNTDGTFSYVHDDSETFTDSFTYIVSDQDGGPTDTGTVTITVTPVNDNDPVAVDDTMTVDEGATQTELDGAVLSVLANDTDIDLPNDTLTAAVDVLPVNGTVTINSDGTFSYTHDGSATTSDSFTYIVTDADAGATATGTISVTVIAPVIPSFVLPGLGTPLTGSSETFEWQTNGASVTEWWLYLGTDVGGAQLHNSGNLGASLSTSVTGLPIDGTTIHARLWYRLLGSSNWVYIDETYIAYTAGAPDITSHMPPGPFTDVTGSEVLVWADNGSGAVEYWVYAGAAVGGQQYYNSGILATTQNTVSGLPLDGSTVWIRLWYRTTGSGTWQYIDEEYTAVAALPAIDSSSGTGVLTSPNDTFTWSDPSGQVTEWWLYIGSTVGAVDYENSGNLVAATSYTTTTSSLPSGSVPVYVRLWYRKGTAVWQFIDQTFTSAP